jgi:hypothetical protein
MVPALVPLWEAPLDVLSWYDCETDSHVLLNFFFGYKAITFESILEVSKSQKLLRVKSGERNGWRVVGIWFIIKKCCTVRDV